MIIFFININIIERLYFQSLTTHIFVGLVGWCGISSRSRISWGRVRRGLVGLGGDHSNQSGNDENLNEKLNLAMLGV